MRRHALALAIEQPDIETPDGMRVATQVFPSANSATALIDRVVHHSDVRATATGCARRGGRSEAAWPSDRRSKFQRIPTTANTGEEALRGDVP
jgi:hypothetical protein